MEFDQEGANLFGYQFPRPEDQPTPFAFNLPTSGTEILNETDRKPTDNLFALLRDGRTPFPLHSENWLSDRPQSLVGVTTSLGHNQLGNSQPDISPHTSSMVNGLMTSFASPHPDILFGNTLSAHDDYAHYQLQSEPVPTSPSAPQNAHHSSGNQASVSFLQPPLALHQPSMPLSIHHMQNYSSLMPSNSPSQHPQPHLPQHHAMIEAANSLTTLNQFSHISHIQPPSPPRPAPQGATSTQPPEDYEETWAVMSGARDPPPSRNTRKPSAHENLIFGSDEQFVKNPHFVPQHSRETSQALAEKQGNVVQHALQRIPSAATTRQSSPAPGVISPKTIMSPGHTSHFPKAGPQIPTETPPGLGISNGAYSYGTSERPAKRLKTPPDSSDKRPARGNIAKEITSGAKGKTASSARAPRSRNKPPKPKRAPLTQEEKRRNHNESERRRREYIAKGFEGLRVARPGINAQAESKADVIRDTTQWLKVLVKNNEYLRQLVEDNGCV